MFDTHCHLSETPLAENLSGTLDSARDAGVTRFLSISAGAGDWEKLTTIATTYAAIIPAFGIHPLLIKPESVADLTRLPHYLQSHRYAPVGEVGLDFYDKPDSIQQQRQIEIFTRQIMIAQSENRPLVIHQRKAQDHCLRILRENRFARGGFAHAFSGSLEQAKQWLDVGFVIGVGTVLLKERSRLREVLRYLPQEAWVLESDAPFMRADNHPCVVAEIARTAAAIRSESVAEISAYTTENALRILKGH